MPSDRAEDKPSKPEAKSDSKAIQKIPNQYGNVTLVNQLKWLAFAKSKLSLGFQHLDQSLLPLMSEDRHGYAICLEKISGWTIPAAVLKTFGDGSYEITVQLSLTMFHISTATFFGSTWLGPSILLGANEKNLPRLIDFDYRDIIYMITRITDPACVGIIEVVVSKVDIQSKTVLAQYGCGWTMLNMFSKPFPQDVSDDKDGSKMKSCSLFAGSPRDLILCTDMNTIADYLHEIPNCSLFFRVYSHRKLTRLQKFIADNEAIGRFEPVAGLVSREIIPFQETKAKWLSCIGHEEILDGGRGIHIYPAKPRMVLPLILKLANCQFFLPKRDSMEVKIIKSMHLAYPEVKQEDIRIISRRLKIGLHNGHTVVTGQYLTFPLIEDKEDRDILLTNEPVITLPNYVPDPFMALVFLVEYEIGVLVEKNTHLDSNMMVRASLNPEKQIISDMTIGGAIYIPCQENKIVLTNTNKGKNEEGVDVEIQVVRDETCGLLSASPMITDQSLSEAEIALITDKDSAGLPISRLSYVAESKNSLDYKKSLQKSMDRIFVKGAKGEQAKIMPPEELKNNEEIEPAMIGFDLKLLHPKLGEIKNQEKIEDLTKVEDKDGKGMQQITEKDDEIDNEKEEENLKIREERTSKFMDEDGTKRKFHSITNSRPRKVSTDDYDDKSVVESIVTGTSDSSNFRLDPFFYRDRFGEGSQARDARDNDSVSSLGASIQRNVQQFNLPPSKLLQHSLNARIAPPGASFAPGAIINPSNQGMTTADMYIASKTMVPLRNNEYFTRDLTRGTKSRLNRHGIQDAIMDTPYHLQQQYLAQNNPLKSRLPYPNQMHVVDIHSEIYDEKNIHEINIQFVGYRTLILDLLSQQSSKEAMPETNNNSFFNPRAVYFTYQFYTCAPTRSEILKLLPAKSGEVNVLVRDDPSVRDEPPLILRYTIDCSRISPLESFEFIDYLAHKSLFVDIWDADALVHLGTIGVPLRKLLRQGQPMVKQAIECDIINSEIIAPTNGGITSLVVTEKGPVAGEIVGSINVILSNYGSVGKGPYLLKDVAHSKGGDVIIPIEGLNWRAHGVDDNRPSTAPSSSSKRPKNSVRAKPLTDTAPDLSRALEDLRTQSMSNAVSYRSLSGNRGAGGMSTLNYDEVVIIFKRFQGTGKGTVQYSGKLMALMDLPSLPVIVKKLSKAFKRYGDIPSFKADITRYANTTEELKSSDIDEWLRSLFERTGIETKTEERTLLTKKLIEECGREGFVKVTQVINFVREETDRLDWILVNNKLKLCCQRAELEGIDVEQMLSDFDPDGKNYISIPKLREFLIQLSKFGKLEIPEMQLICRFFGRHRVVRPSSGKEDRKDNDDEGFDYPISDPVSLAEVMAAVGKEYVGNLQIRIKRYLQQQDETVMDVKYLLRVLYDGAEPDGRPSFLYSQVENSLRALGITTILSPKQIQGILKKLDIQNNGKITVVSLCNYLGIPFKASDLVVVQKEVSRKLSVDLEDTDDNRGKKSISSTASITAEELLSMLLRKVQDNGVAVDQAFRHFDTNGDGSISIEEFESGLHKLDIFESIPNWTRQLPAILTKFDKTGDGLVSLREFFHFLGIDNYAPNIIQRLTKIFALVISQQKLSFQDIFHVFDQDKNGSLDAHELIEGIKQLGTFGDVTKEDANAVIKQFDNDGDAKISLQEFIDFFAERVQKDIKHRQETNRAKIVQRFRKIMQMAEEKGATIEAIFGHLDKDGGGSISTSELAQGLQAIPSFSSLSKEDIQTVIASIDTDNSGDISLDEFKLFVKGPQIPPPTSNKREEKKEESKGESKEDRQVFINIFEQLHSTCTKAMAKGLTFTQLFQLADRDLSSALTLSEFHQLLLKLPSFKGITRDQIEPVFELLDADHSGTVSTSEFKDFIELGKEGYIAKLRNPVKKTIEKIIPPVKRVEEYSLEEVKEVFIRNMRRISEIDGSIRGLLAYLDDDEDGLIKKTVFFSLLRRERVFDFLNEGQINQLLQPFYFIDYHGEYSKSSGSEPVVFLRVGSLLPFLEGRKDSMSTNLIRMDLDRDDEEIYRGGESKEERSKRSADNDELVSLTYIFSQDPEVKAVEKKLRGFGRIIAKKGIDVEREFRTYDMTYTGSIARTDFVKVLSTLGMYLLEEGKVLQDNTINNLSNFHGNTPGQDIRQLQLKQIKQLNGSKSSPYVSNVPNLAKKMFNLSSDPRSMLNSEFKNHIESLAVIDWYRQGQKQMLLQHILSHSLSHKICLFPRFGNTLFFEYPIHNPFPHEERFEIEVQDPELRLVVTLDEWLHLRKTSRPCVGELGPEPMEVEMFDRDASNGKIQVALLPNETLFLPFTYMTLLPYSPIQSPALALTSKRRSSSEDGKESDNSNASEPAQRVAEVKIVSGSHGHIIAILKCSIFPRPFIVDRCFRFHEYENTIAKRKIELIHLEDNSLNPGDYYSSRGTNKFVHCVESTVNSQGKRSVSGADNSRVVVEWGSNHVFDPYNVTDNDQHRLQLLIRYRCMEAPATGSFYLLLYNDPYQSQLHEIWQVIVHSRMRLDVHGTVGSPTTADLVLRGDKFPRRARAYASTSQTQFIRFKPENVFQLVPGAYNRVIATIQPKYVGNRRALINVVDADSRELLSAWLVSIQANSPAVMRSYDVEVPLNKALYKKILFKNPWDIRRRFVLTSSDESLMRPRTTVVEIAPLGSTYLRLWFAPWAGLGKVSSDDNGRRPGQINGEIRDVYLFLNDADEGQSEECHLFRVREAYVY